MKVLVLGGTQFIGRHVVDALRHENHDITLLNRGKTGPSVFPDLKFIQADRESDDLHLRPELRQNWDAIIDLCAYYPTSLSKLLETLNGYAGLYVQCSTISVYRSSINIDPCQPMREDLELFDCTEAEATDTSMMTYGKRKAACERLAVSHHSRGLPMVIIRPSVVYGQYDHTDRFAYWIWRGTRNQKFLLPEDGLTITQLTYAPDLANAFCKALSTPMARGKAYNIADSYPLSLRTTLQIIADHTGARPFENAVSVNADILTKLEVVPFRDLPLWIPGTHFLVDTQRAREELDFISTPAKTAVQTATDAFLKLNRPPKAGIGEKVELDLISRINSGLSAK